MLSILNGQIKESEIIINGTEKGVEKRGAFYKRDQKNGFLVPLSGFFHIEMSNTRVDLGTFKDGKIDKKKNYFIYCRSGVGVPTNKGGFIGEELFEMMIDGKRYQVFTYLKKPVYVINGDIVDNMNDFPELFKKVYNEGSYSIKNIDEASLNAGKLLNNNNQQNNDDNTIVRIEPIQTNNKEKPILQFINNKGEVVASFDYDKINTYKTVATFDDNKSTHGAVFVVGRDISRVSSKFPKGSGFILTVQGDKQLYALPVSYELRERLEKCISKEDRKDPLRVFKRVRDFALEEQAKRPTNNDNNQPQQNQNHPIQSQPINTPINPQPNQQNNTSNQTQQTGNGDKPKDNSNIPITVVNDGNKTDNNQSNNTQTDTQNNAKEMSYIPSFISGGIGAGGFGFALLMKNKKIALIIGCSVGALSFIGCVIYSIYAYSHNKDINNKSSNNNLNNKGQEQGNGK